MTQDRASGAAAGKWGRETARALARQLGATAPVGNNSNECLLDGKRVVIKCAKPATSSVGVTFHMLKKLDAVAGAFQRDDGAFAIWLLTAALFKDHMRDTRSRSSAGRVGIVSRDVFETKGKALGRVRL